MEQYAIRNILSFDECESFVRSFCDDEIFSDPMLSNEEQLKNNLVKPIERTERFVVFGIFKGQKMTGLFSFLVLKDEHYLEMLVGLSRDEKAYHMMMSYLREHFASFSADFVFNPRNHLLYDLLKQNGAEFDIEQQKMVLVHPVSNVDTSTVRLLSKPYIPSYLEMHNTDLYWTGDKVIKAQDRFRTFVVIEDECVIGYLDVTCCFEENEPVDLLVKEEHRRKGHGRKLVAKALEMNQPNNMMLLVDADNYAAIQLYESLGFKKVNHQNSLFARLNIEALPKNHTSNNK